MLKGILRRVRQLFTRDTARVEQRWIIPGLLDAMNRERFIQGHPRLDLDLDLDLVAQRHAETMASRKSQDHGGADEIRHRLRRAGYRTDLCGENILAGPKSYPEVIDACLRSDPHRDNLLRRDFTAAGVGASLARDGVLYWCIVFAGDRQEKRNGIRRETNGKLFDSPWLSGPLSPSRGKSHATGREDHPGG